MKTRVLVPVIVSILILGVLGTAQDAFAPKKLFVGGLSWDAESQSFEVVLELNHGMFESVQHSGAMIETGIWLPIAGVGYTHEFPGDPIQSDDFGKIKIKFPWDRTLPDGSEFTGLIDVEIESQILNPAGKPIAVAEPLTASVEVTPRGTPPPDDETPPPDDIKTKTINISHFKLDIAGDQISTPNGKWYEVSGGDFEIDLTEMTSGKDDQGQSRPGQMYFADITLRGPFVSDRDPLDEWIGDLNESKPEQNTNDKNNPINVESQKLAVELNCAFLESLGQVFVKQQTEIDDTVIDIIDLPPVPVQTTVLVIHELVLSNVAIASSDTEIDPLSGWVFDDTSDGEGIRKNISVIIQKRDGSESTRFNLFDCFPTRHDVINVDSRSGASAIKEVIELSVERAEYE